MKILSTSVLERTFKGKMEANKVILSSVSVASVTFYKEYY